MLIESLYEYMDSLGGIFFSPNFQIKSIGKFLIGILGKPVALDLFEKSIKPKLGKDCVQALLG